MVRITDQLYLGKCEDCPLVLAGNHHVLLTCHYPCDRLQAKKATCQPLREAMGRAGDPGGREIAILDLLNQEIPNYRIQDFTGSLDILSRWIKDGRNVTVISEHAQSRAASLALLWMAFRQKSLSRSSYSAARADFKRIYPHYLPWPGMIIFLNQEWDAFL